MPALIRDSVLYSLLLGAAVVGCRDDSDGGAAAQAVCTAVAPADCPEPAPHYADVAPIFKQRCASCHTGVGDGPWPLNTYQDVADWAPIVRDELLRCTMPPSDSAVALAPDEREQILNWLQCGYPE